jgi:hypothetical protein
MDNKKIKKIIEIEESRGRRNKEELEQVKRLNNVLEYGSQKGLI